MPCVRGTVLRGPPGSGGGSALAWCEWPDREIYISRLTGEGKVPGTRLQVAFCFCQPFVTMPLLG